MFNPANSPKLEPVSDLNIAKGLGFQIPTPLVRGDEVIE
jgi:hypothetical protein